MNKRSETIIALVVAAAVVAGGWFFLKQRASDGASVHYIARPVGYADISATVSETGTVNPVTQVEVGSEVSGTILTLSVDYNSIVRKGQVLTTLDPTTFQAVVDSAQANLSLTEATLDSAKVNVGKMKALLDLANLTVQQDEPLAKQGLINENQIDSERTAAITSEQDYLAAQSAVKVAEAQVLVAKGQLEQARFNLSKTIITSPFNGIVMARNISIGQTVASSLQTPTLFTLATNLTDMQVDTSVDEADVGSVKMGEAAQLTVTAFPNHPFAGTVSQVRVNPTTVQNVVTYDAVISVHDTSGMLLPGMTAQVNIEVGKRPRVLAVPIAAVLYRPLTAQSPSQPTSAFGGGFGAGVMQSSGGPPAGQAVAGAPGSQVTLWLLRDGHPLPVQVVIGLSDGKNIEITSGDLVAGDQVIVAQYRGAARNGAGHPSASADTPPKSPRTGGKPADAAPATNSQNAAPAATGAADASGGKASAGQ
ncbi:MAG: efflux RND transporter periplasmic adaptor subunit [Rectinemataceae bacterium]|jgi:HlyD family secretion protein